MRRSRWILKSDSRLFAEDVDADVRVGQAQRLAEPGNAVGRLWWPLWAVDSLCGLLRLGVCRASFGHRQAVVKTNRSA